MRRRIMATPNLRLLIALATAVVVTVLMYSHVSPINGPWYWKWLWQWVPWSRYWLMLPAVVPFALAQRLASRRAVALALLVFCGLQLRVTYTIIQDDHLGFDWLTSTVRSPTIVSYYSDAAGIARDPQWLADYPQILPLTNLHTQSKPPGPVAYYMLWIRLLGYGDRSALAGGLGVIVLEAGVVLLVYLLARELTADSTAAFAAASFISVCPGAVLMIPMLDPLYPAWTCAILWCWQRALRTERTTMSFVAGMLLGTGTFFTYSLLTLGVFVLILTSFVSRPRAPMRSVARLTLSGAVGLLGFYGVLWAFTFFDPIATFQSAWHNQQALLAAHHNERPYPATILFDLTDFALGMGWIGAALTLMACVRAASPRSLSTPQRWLIAGCVIQPVVVAVLGIMQSETLRVWNFMLPLTATAAGVELALWTPRARSIALWAMFIVMLAIGQNLQV